jgi:hypothetical protein
MITESVQSWKPEVEVDGKWSTNALRFATEEEAAMSARDLFNRWMLTTNHRATPSDDTVNYSINIETGEMVRV